MSCFESQPPAASAAVVEPTTAALGTRPTAAPGLGDSDLPLPPRFPLLVFRVGVLSSKLMSLLIGGGLGPTCCMMFSFHKRTKESAAVAAAAPAAAPLARATRDRLQAFPGQPVCACTTLVVSFKVFSGVDLLVCVSGKGMWSIC